MTVCVHGCDDSGWLATDSGLMPCPRHRLDDHERWAEGQHQPTGGSIGVEPPTDHHVVTGRAGLAAARAALDRDS
jgi:hypothetical protein